MVRRRNFLAGSALLLGGCSGTSSAAKPLTFWTMQLQPEHTTLIQGMLTEFSRQYPEAGSVQWVDVPWSDMERKILSAVAAGTAPDVVNLNPQFAVKLAQRKALRTLEQAVPAADQARYFPSLWQGNQLDGAIFGLPWYVSTQVTMYNQTLFKQAGLSKAPATYPELRQVAQAIKQKTGKYAFLPTFDTAQILQSWVQMGVTLRDKSNKAAFDSPAGLAALNYWVSLYQDKLIPPETLTEGHRKSMESYQSGETALLLTGPQFLQSIAKNSPELVKVTGVSPQIRGTTGKAQASAMNLVIPKDSPQGELALKLALFITNDANQLALAKAGNLLPSTQLAAKDPFFTRPGADAVTTGRVVSAKQLADAVDLVPPFDNLDQLEKLIYDGIQLAMINKKAPAQALKEAAEQWNSLPT